MNHALAMRLVERLGYRNRNRECLGDLDRAATQTLGQRLSLEVFGHDEVGRWILVADVNWRADIGPIE